MAVYTQDRVMSIRDIGELIRTQDNRMADQPMFIVQELEKVHGMDRDCVNKYEWFNSDEQCGPEDDEHEDHLELMDEDEANDEGKRTQPRENAHMRVGLFPEQRVPGCVQISGRVASTGSNSKGVTTA